MQLRARCDVRGLGAALPGRRLSYLCPGWATAGMRSPAVVRLVGSAETGRGCPAGRGTTRPPSKPVRDPVEVTNADLNCHDVESTDSAVPAHHRHHPASATSHRRGQIGDTTSPPVTVTSCSTRNRTAPTGTLLRTCVPSLPRLVCSADAAQLSDEQPRHHHHLIIRLQSYCPSQATRLTGRLREVELDLDPIVRCCHPAIILGSTGKADARANPRINHIRRGDRPIADIPRQPPRPHRCRSPSHPTGPSEPTPRTRRP